MKIKNKIFIFLVFLLYAIFTGCQGIRGKTDTSNIQNPAAQLSETELQKLKEEQEKAALRDKIKFVGTNEGLFSVNPAGNLTSIWNRGSVRKIVSLGNNTWAIMGNEGIFVSNDLRNWEPRIQGLPIKTIKVFENGKKSFLQIVQDIKDFEVYPENPQIMVCAVKDKVYLSRNQGQSWTSLGGLHYITNGIKAVAVANMPRTSGNTRDLTVFLSHSIYGIHYIQPNLTNAKWIEMTDGIENLETTNNQDEAADISVVVSSTPEGIISNDIYVSQSFRRRIFKLDWSKKKYSLIWSDDSPFGTVDSLFPINNEIFFLHERTIASIDLIKSTMKKHPEILSIVRSVPAQIKLNCIAINDKDKNDSDKILLSELWLLDEPEPGKPVPQNNHIAANKEGLYFPVNHAIDSKIFQTYMNTIERAGLNMIVIDMKDDYGRLRFKPNNPEITAKGRVLNPLDIDTFLRNMKNRGIYTVARIVVFKDKELAGKEKGKFAVWDSRNNKPWVGYSDKRRNKSTITESERNDNSIQIFPTDDPDVEIVRSLNDESWVDPYSEDVWEYIALLSEELHERGFDEIQYDYIRFPTDGDNLGDASYRWRDSGMDMESAILSFIRHVRKRVKAPISIDIYGANGWYRTGARTGQEVELLAPWVDVICPMYYPSHFEQYFLAQKPPELRPWRIYFHGTLRNSRITRGQVIIRPWAQAFYLNVSYDRQYYNRDYIRRQIEGVRLAGNGGFTYWNNSGRYEDIPDK